MKTVVLFDSQYGNTEQVARAIAGELAAGGPVEVVAAAQGTPLLDGVDLLVVGGPTQGHGVSPALRACLAALAPALDGRLAAAFDTRLPMMKLLSGSAADGIARTLKKHGARLLAPPESFLVTGREGPLAPDELARASTWGATLLALARTELPVSVAAG